MKTKTLLTWLVLSFVFVGCGEEGSHKMHVKSKPDTEFNTYVANIKGAVFRCRFNSKEFPMGLVAFDKDNVTIHLREAETKKIAQRSFGVNSENPKDDHVDRFVITKINTEIVLANHVYQLKGASTEEKKGKIDFRFDLPKRSGRIIILENGKPADKALIFVGCDQLRAFPGTLKKPEKKEDVPDDDNKFDAEGNPKPEPSNQPKVPEKRLPT
jgi:hypothetical protein